MGIRFSERAKRDMRAEDVSEEEIGECFPNRLGGYLRYPHKLGPQEPDWFWFLGQTNMGLTFAIYYSIVKCLIDGIEKGNNLVHFVHTPTKKEVAVYDQFGKNIP